MKLGKFTPAGSEVLGGRECLLDFNAVKIGESSTFRRNSEPKSKLTKKPANLLPASNVFLLDLLLDCNGTGDMFLRNDDLSPN